MRVRFAQREAPPRGLPRSAAIASAAAASAAALVSATGFDDNEIRLTVIAIRNTNELVLEAPKELHLLEPKPSEESSAIDAERQRDE